MSVPRFIGLCPDPQHQAVFYMPLEPGQSVTCPMCPLEMVVYEPGRMSQDSEGSPVIQVERGCDANRAGIGCGCTGACHELIDVVPAGDYWRVAGQLLQVLETFDPENDLVFDLKRGLGMSVPPPSVVAICDGEFAGPAACVCGHRERHVEAAASDETQKPEEGTR